APGRRRPRPHDRGRPRRRHPPRGWILRVSGVARGGGESVTEHLSSEEQELLEERLLRAASATAPPATIPRRDSTEPAPLSFAQTRLWFFDQLLPSSPLYNISFTARLRFALDPRIFKQALRHVVGRHEVLRTVFVLDGDEPVQVVRPEVDAPISAFDLRAL